MALLTEGRRGPRYSFLQTNIDGAKAAPDRLQQAEWPTANAPPHKRGVLRL